MATGAFDTVRFEEEEAINLTRSPFAVPKIGAPRSRTHALTHSFTHSHTHTQEKWFIELPAEKRRVTAPIMRRGAMNFSRAVLLAPLVGRLLIHLIISHAG